MTTPNHALTFEEITHGLYWVTQTDQPLSPALRIRFYKDHEDKFLFLESNVAISVKDLVVRLLRFVPIAEHNAGRPGTGSGPGGAVTLCDEHYELGEQ